MIQELRKDFKNLLSARHTCASLLINMHFFVFGFIYRTLERAGWERIGFEDATSKIYKKRKWGNIFKITTKPNLQTKQCKPRIERGNLYSYTLASAKQLLVHFQGRLCLQKEMMKLLHPKYFKPVMHFFHVAKEWWLL